VDAAEIEDKDYPGERLVVCRNPFQAEECPMTLSSPHTGQLHFPINLPIQG
jgi:hypothetical protein